jgi:hypothetical protein
MLIKNLVILSAAAAICLGTASESFAGPRRLYRQQYVVLNNASVAGPDAAANGVFFNWLMGLGNTILPQVIPILINGNNNTNNTNTNNTVLPPPSGSTVKNTTIQSMESKLANIESKLGIVRTQVQPPSTSVPQRPNSGTPNVFPEAH